MLSNKDAHLEIEAMDKVIENGSPEEVQKSILKALTLVIKLELNNRANVVTMMRHQGIELLKPNVRKDDAKKETSE